MIILRTSKPSVAVLLLCLWTAMISQSPASAQQEPPPQEKPTDTVRITTNLVQIDAVVTDSNGKQVTDLHPEDFEVFEDNRLQTIKNFSYIRLQPTASAASTSTSGNKTAAATVVDKSAPPPPPVRLRPEEVRRTIALVVDDLGLSWESTAFVRQALKKFVDQQMQPGDLVAIVRTGAGVGALQQFTADKRMLYAAIERIKFSFMGRAGISAFASIEDDSLDTLYKRPGLKGGKDGVDFSQPDPNLARLSPERGAREDENNYKEEIFSVGTLGALNFIVRGLRELPGRKSVVLLSDSLPLEISGAGSERILTALHQLTDLANRASVNIYTIDARGLPTLNLAAQDNVPTLSSSSASIDDASNRWQDEFSNRRNSGITATKIEELLTQRGNDYFNSQSGLAYLALQTGGFFIHNNNDIGAGIKRVLDDQNGYYLIGYRPDESTFDPKTGARNFHKLTIRVKRPGLTVRSRSGFFGITTEEARPVRRTREAQLMAAITSPFASGALNLRLTSLFANDSAEGSVIRSLLYIDGKSLSFTDEPDGSHKAVVDLLAMTFGDDGVPIDQRSRTETIHARGDEYQDLLKNGLIFGINLPVKKAGAYQLRVAVRDATTESVGSASEFIEVPNLSQNRLTLSGIYLTSHDAREAKRKSAATVNTAHPAAPEGNATDSAKGEQPDSQTDPAVRRFLAGSALDYGVEIYNARQDNASGHPQLLTQVRLYRDNQQVFASQISPVASNRQTNAKRLAVIGHIQLEPNMAAGEYVLQIVVTDTLAKEKKYRTATQWIDFKVN